MRRASGQAWLAWKSTVVVAPAVGNPTPRFLCSAMQITKASEPMAIFGSAGRDFRPAIVSSVSTATWLTKCGAAVLTVPLNPFPAGPQAEPNFQMVQKKQKQEEAVFS